MLSIEGLGTVYSDFSHSAGATVSDIHHISTDDDVGGITYEVEQLGSKVEEAEESVDSYSKHVADLEDVIATLLGVIDEVRGSTDIGDIHDIVRSIPGHPLALDGDVHLSEVGFHGDALGQLASKLHSGAWHNDTTKQRLEHGPYHIKYEFANYKGLCVSNISKGKAIYRGIKMSGADYKDYYYKDHMKEVLAPTEAEMVLWEITTGEPFITAVEGDTQ